MADTQGELAVPVEAAALIGRVRERLHLVTSLDIRKFAQAIGEANPIHFDKTAALVAGFSDIVAPALFFQAMTFDPVSPDQLPPDGSPVELDVPVPAVRAMGGSSACTVSRLIHAGEQIRVRSVLTDVQIKQGRSGPLYAIVVKTEFLDEKDALVACETATYLKRP